MATAASQGQKELRVPANVKWWSPYPFGGMNVEASPLSIDDREFTYIENYFRLGDGKLRTAWDAGTAIYTASGSLVIIYYYFFTLKQNYYCAVFLSDGSAVQIDMASKATVQMGPSGTFYQSGGNLPVCSQYGNLGVLLIANNNATDDYWAWDGTLLYGAGGAAPFGVVISANGNNYTSLPVVTPFGGEGSGMVVVPTINAGGVVQGQITNPGTGYQVGDVVQLQFSGGGSDTGAILKATLNSGGVAAVNVTAPGSGYTGTPTVAFSGGGGSGAQGTVLTSTGISAVTVTAGGSGYTTAGVAFSGGGGSGATAVAVIVGGVITAISIVSAGTGYTSAPTVAISGDGTAGAATASVYNAGIIGVTITNPGSGYTSAPSVAFSGAGSGATGGAILAPQSISGVTVVNGGTGYTNAPNIQFVGGNGVGATGIVQLTGTSIAKVNVVAGGQNYNNTPTINILGGGGGSGAVLTPVLGGGQVIAINVSSGGSGYTQNVEVQILPADFGKTTQDTGTGAGAVAVFAPTSIASVQMSNYGRSYTNAPAVVINPGANNSAYAVVTLMPFGVSGTTMETYQSRVWIAAPAQPGYSNIYPGGNFQVSAAGSITDFATSDGGVQFTNSDSFLQTRYTALKQSNGYMYFFGDASVSVATNVQTSGSSASTTFNYQNVDPQIGCSWRDSLVPYGRSLIFGNETGAHGLYGGAVTRVSAKLNDLFVNAVFPPKAGAIYPSSGIATIFEVRHFFMLMTITDPDSGALVNKMITWNEREWVITSQSVSLTFIASQNVGTRSFLWGTDGKKLYPLFAKPSATLVKRLDTKTYGGNEPFEIKSLQGIWVVAQDQTATNAGITIDTNFITSGLPNQAPLDPSVPDENLNGSVVLFQPIQFYAPKPYWPTYATGSPGLYGVNFNIQMSTVSPDFILGHFLIGYADEAPIFG